MSAPAISGTRWVHYFSDPPPGGADLAALLGGKGASLKRMTLAGLRVPPGFTIGVPSCRRYFELGRRWPEGLENEVRANLGRLEAETGRPFGRGPRPLLVSVRSGAERSMPGMMDTVLNCGLAADGQAASEPWALLAQAINDVFDSWRSERAAAYRARHGIHRLAGTAVTVQAMFPAAVSGVAFTRNPNDPAADEILIEAAPGLGEAVVSGAVTPDRFVIERASLELRRPETRGTGPGGAGDGGAADGAAPCLAPDQLRELTSLALRVEEHFGHPVDIEWAWADGGFALLQARRIRGLETARLAEECRAGEEARLRALAGGGRRLWVIHNLAETLRHPTPLSWDLWRRFMGAGGGFGVLYRSLGYRPPPPARDQGFLELIGGFIYADPERLAGFFWDGMPLAYDLDALAADPSLIEAAPSEFDPARADGRFLRKLPANLLAMWRAGRALRRAERDARRRFEEEALPPFLAYVDAKRRQNLAALPDAGVLEELRAREGAVLDGFAPESLRPGFLGALAFARLRARLAQFLGEEDGNALASRLTRSLEGDTTFAQDALLWRTARGEAPMSEFLERYGHRAAGEMELAEPRWREYPAPVERLARRLAAAGGRGPEEVHREGVRERLAAQAELPALLERAGASSLREEVERDLAAAQALLPYRESGKHYLMMGYELLRRAAEELARRWELGGGVYYLRLEELPELPRDAGRLRDAIEERRKRREAMRRIDLPAVIDSRRLDELRRQDGSGAAGAAELAGTPLAAGAATGTARIVLEPDDAAELEGDAILVCPSTDPGWTPLFFSVRGLVVERGGVLSHGAIVARDFGIPAVACPGATRLLRSGDRVRLDGKTGRVTVLARGGSRA